MPPPVVPQQGSKVGLISALVITAILAVVMTVFYFQEQGKRVAAEAERDAIPGKYKGYLKLGDPELERFKTINDAKKYAALGSENAVDVPRIETNMVIRAVTGHDAEAIVEGAAAPTSQPAGTEGEGATASAGPRRPAEIVRDYLNGMRDAARKKLIDAGVDPRAAGLDNAGGDLAKQLDWYADQYVKLLADSKKANTDHAAALAAIQAKSATDLKAATDQYTTQLGTLKAERDARDAQIATLTAALQKKMEEVGSTQLADVSAKQAEIDAEKAKIPPLDAKIKELEAVVESYKYLWPQYRKDTRDNMVRRPDAMITQVLDDGTCYINIGQGAQIAVGMTFEVYDPNGIPGLLADIPRYEDDYQRRGGDKGAAVAAAAEKGGGLAAVGLAQSKGAAGKYDLSLPQGGKGSVEVIKVGPGPMSLCRIVKTETRQTIKPGDQVANLVYDPNVKTKFVVFGEFDMDYDDRPKAADKATIRRLIEQWGGKAIDAKTADDFGPEADFIVVGIAPKVLVLTEEEKGNPSILKQYEDSVAARKAYDDVLAKARTYSIPVLNQTRFLYYTGFFDQRLR